MNQHKKLKRIFLVGHVKHFCDGLWLIDNPMDNLGCDLTASERNADPLSHAGKALSAGNSYFTFSTNYSTQPGSMSKAGEKGLVRSK